MNLRIDRLLVRYFQWMSRFFFYLAVALIAAFSLEIIESGIIGIIGTILSMLCSSLLCSLSDELVSSKGGK